MPILKYIVLKKSKYSTKIFYAFLVIGILCIFSYVMVNFRLDLIIFIPYLLFIKFKKHSLIHVWLVLINFKLNYHSYYTILVNSDLCLVSYAKVISP
jgi:hypothetical protein